MKYFEIKNAVNPIRFGPKSYLAEPIVMTSGIWIGVLALNEAKVDPKEFLKTPRVLRELTLEEYEDLKKNKGTSSQESEVSPPAPPDAAPAEDPKPEKVEEVLLEGEAEIVDPLDEKPKPKKKQPRKKK